MKMLVLSILILAAACGDNLVAGDIGPDAAIGPAACPLLDDVQLLPEQSCSMAWAPDVHLLSPGVATPLDDGGYLVRVDGLVSVPGFAAGAVIWRERDAGRHCIYELCGSVIVPGGVQ